MYSTLTSIEGDVLMDADRRKLVERLEKLLNLGQSSNANEAAVALEKAARMMEEHELSQSEVHASKVGEVHVKSTQSVSKPKDWEASFVKVVASAFGCRVLWLRGDSRRLDYWGRFVLVGHTDRLALAEYTTTVLLRELVKARTKFSRQLSQRGFTRGPDMTAELDGFCKGWVTAARLKVQAFANSPELEAALNERMSLVKTARNSQDRGTGMFGVANGYDAGSDVTIHRPMSESRVARLGSR